MSAATVASARAALALQRGPRLSPLGVLGQVVSVRGPRSCEVCGETEGTRWVHAKCVFVTSPEAST